MRIAAALVLFLASIVFASADTYQRYSGVVRRTPSGKPVAGVTILAYADPAPSPFFWIPRGPQELGSTVTARDGSFEFTLSAPQRRLWFIAMGMPKITPGKILLRDVALRRPRPDKLNLISVPEGFQSRKKSIIDLTGGP
jgi:hypothetical protein